MENSSFKTSMFGGFDRQSVIDYIEKTARETTDVQESLRKENEALAAAKSKLEQEVAALAKRVVELEQRGNLLAGELAAKSAAYEESARELEELRPKVEALTAEVEQLRPEAEAYANVKSHVGEIEFSAQKRANELEAATTARLNQLVAECKRQYQEMVSTFGTASAHALSELRKVEVNLTQLPRAFDKMGCDLIDLEFTLKKDKE